MISINDAKKYLGAKYLGAISGWQCWGSNAEAQAPPERFAKAGGRFTRLAAGGYRTDIYRYLTDIIDI